jgi:hypothetical protein
MSDPVDFLPPAVNEEIEARTRSGNPFSVDELKALFTTVIQEERDKKDEKKKVEKEAIRKKRRKSPSPQPSMSLPPASSKEESKPSSSLVAEGEARSEATATVEPQADPVEEVTSQKKETEEGEPAMKKPRSESFVQGQPQKQSDNTLQEQTEQNDDDDKSDESIVKRTNKVVKKEFHKSTSGRKRERSSKGQKRYEEDDDQRSEEVEVTGSRNPVEVYQEDFDDELTDDADHKSMEKDGNCTVIQEANTSLMVKFGDPKVGMCNLQNVYSKEKCDDSITTASYLNVLTCSLLRTLNR